MAGIRTIEDAIEAISTQLRLLAQDARNETNPARRQRLADAIDNGIQVREFLVAVKRAHLDTQAEERARKEAAKYMNYLHRTFGGDF